MIQIVVPKQQLFNENTEEFVNVEETVLEMEHSLKAVRIWEAKWHKPFLDNHDKTKEEIFDYMRIMCLNENVDPMVFRVMSQDNIEQVVSYIQNPMTATWFNNDNRIGASLKSGEIVTAEIIYYWMISMRVPLELENWHLNQLLTLLKVISIKNGGKKKMSKKEAALQRAKLNAERRKKLKTKG